VNRMEIIANGFFLRGLFFVCAFGFWSNAVAQHRPNDSLFKERFTKSQMTDDFDQMVKELEKHPRLGVGVNKVSWKKLVNEQKQKIGDSFSIDQFYRLCLPVVSKIGCGHTNLYNLHYNNMTKKSLVHLPYRVVISKGRLFVLENLSTNKMVPLGAEIVEINGKPVTEIIAFVMDCVPADGHNVSYKRQLASKGFTYYYHSLFGLRNRNTIKYLLKGENKLLELDLKSLKAAPAKKKKRKKALDFQMQKEIGVGILTIRTFSFYQQKQKFYSFIDQSMKSFFENKLRHLVIDLRGNQGGDPYCSSYLLRAIADRPIQYYQSDLNYPELLRPAPSLGFSFPFKTMVLIDGLGFSSTGHFAALVKEHHLGIFVGQPLGSTFRCYGGRRNSHPKNTGLFLQVGQKQVDVKVTPSEFKLEQGIQPDFAVQPTVKDQIDQRDLWLEKVKEIVAKRNSSSVHKPR